ncbi:Na(+)/H(+)-K(+) antiporter GerN [Andreprevotia sp. IGB-42]|uniref:cation:proton antiporter n=1 Tax=Andreprevotia sp. IGB-42 TaxID=2497473 RepID=UPI001357C21D|nr:cation:proton antiporter [Andreprevotia sp. IGB-42]KAF0813776.1 Na(+)/H(+)-K(+) antiporter GerN [Andreprevotia sp. IGB-42]
MSIFILPLAYCLVVLACRAGGWLARHLGQPAVIGEIAAGMVLGPSVLGALWPTLSELAFTPVAIKSIGWLGDAGAVVFLFLLGAEFDTRVLSRHSRSVVMTTKFAFLLPGALGGLLAWLIGQSLLPALPVPQLAFVALACSLTALPVLARILDEQRITHTDIGRHALASAVLTDAVSWLLLSIIVLTSMPQHGMQGALRLAAIAAYGLILLGPLRRRCKTLGVQIADGSNRTALPELALYLVASALATAGLGLHALLGAFALGLLLPRNERTVQALQQKAAPFCRWLLPCFFAAIGLSTQLGQQLAHGLWWLALAITAAAVIGKVGGCLLAGLFNRQPLRTSLTLGVLMNTRGMMELVVLNLGRQLGLIAEPYFSAMLIMAIATTLMTTPLLKLLGSFETVNSNKPAVACTEIPN